MNLLQEALLGDRCTFMAYMTSDLQIMLSNFSDAYKMFGLTISLGRTGVLVQPAPDNIASPLSITIDGKELKTVDSFKYLGSVISNNGQLDKEIYVRIIKDSAK